MPVACVLSRAELGLDAPLVQVEVHLGMGLPAFTIVGLPAPVVRESRERVRAALLNSGYQFPPRRITVNLAPVELSKQGGRFDLPIALGVLIASGQLHAARHTRFECYGELGLSGELKPVKGLFLAAPQAAQGWTRTPCSERQPGGSRAERGGPRTRTEPCICALRWQRSPAPAPVVAPTARAPRSTATTRSRLRRRRGLRHRAACPALGVARRTFRVAKSP